MKSVGTAAFSCCLNLTSIVLSPSMKEIPVNAFTSCGLINIEIPEGVEVLNKDCFAKNHSLKSVALWLTSRLS
ncbi:leucine-rich repeat protein [Sodaliphilus sp.]|uniref:leucine-rich repeat protein n=1 Tax=Sodaliphilus sp. TaxID=2815818 RepID=UPI00388E1EDE